MMNLVVLSLLSLQAISYRMMSSFRLNKGRTLNNRYKTILQEAANGQNDNMLGEQLQELIEGVEKFQETAYSSVYGKDIKWKNKIVASAEEGTEKSKEAEPKPVTSSTEEFPETLPVVVTESAVAEDVVNTDEVIAPAVAAKSAVTTPKIAPKVIEKAAVITPTTTKASVVVPPATSVKTTEIDAEKFTTSIAVVTPKRADPELVEGLVLKDIPVADEKPESTDAIDVLRAMQGVSGAFIAASKKMDTSAPAVVNAVSETKEAIVKAPVKETPKESAGGFFSFLKSDPNIAVAAKPVESKPVKSVSDSAPVVKAAVKEEPPKVVIKESPVATKAPAKEAAGGMFDFLKSDPNIVPRPSSPPTIALAFMKKPERIEEPTPAVVTKNQIKAEPGVTVALAKKSAETVKPTSPVKVETVPSGGFFGMFGKPIEDAATATVKPAVVVASKVEITSPPKEPVVAVKASPIIKAQDTPKSSQGGFFGMFGKPVDDSTPAAPKVEVKAVPKVELKVAPKVEPKVVETKPVIIAVKASPVVKAKETPKSSQGGFFGMFGKPVDDSTPVAPKVEVKAVSKVEPKVAAKSEPKVIAKVEPKVASKVEPKVTAKSEIKPVIAAKTSQIVKTQEIPKSSQGGFFGMFGKPIDDSTPVAPKVEVKAAPKVEMKVTPKVEQKVAETKPVNVVKVSPVAKAKETPKSNQGGFFGIFGNPSAEAAAPKAETKTAVPPKVAPKLADIKPAPKVTAAKPVVKAPEPPKVVPKVIAAVKSETPAKPASAGFFGIFGSSSSKPEVPVAAKKLPVTPVKAVEKPKSPLVPIKEPVKASLKANEPAKEASGGGLFGFFGKANEPAVVSTTATGAKSSPAKPVAKVSESVKVASKVTVKAPIVPSPTTMNPKFIAMVTKILGANSPKLKSFQLATNDFRSGVKTAPEFYKVLISLFGEDNIAAIVEPLILELPEKDLSISLKATYNKATKQEEPKSAFGFFGGSKRSEEKPAPKVDSKSTNAARSVSKSSTVVPPKQPIAPISKDTASSAKSFFSFGGTSQKPLQVPAFKVPSKLPTSKKAFVEAQFKACFEGSIEVKVFYDNLVKNIGKATAKLIVADIAVQLPKEKGAKLNSVSSADK